MFVALLLATVVFLGGMCGGGGFICSVLAVLDFSLETVELLRLAVGPSSRKGLSLFLLSFAWWEEGGLGEGLIRYQAESCSLLSHPYMLVLFEGTARLDRRSCAGLNT